MNRIYISILAAGLLAAGAVHAQTLDRAVITAAKHQARQAPAVTVEKAEGMLRVAFDVNLPEDFLRSREAYIITPQLVSGDLSRTLPSLSVEGRTYSMLVAAKTRRELGLDAREYLDHVRYHGKPLTVHYQAEVPYSVELERAMICLVTEKVTNCGKNTCQVEASKTWLDRGVSDLAGFAKSRQVVYAFIDPFFAECVYNEHFSGKLLFALNEARFTEPAAYEHFVSQVRKIVGTPHTEILGVSVVAASSPDGPVAENEKLAEERGELMYRLLTEELGVSAGLVSLKTVGENWDGFTAALNAKDIAAKTRADIDRIMKIKDLNWREWELLHAHRGIFLELCDELRNCSVEVRYTTLDKFASEFDFTEVSGKTLHAVTLGDKPGLDLDMLRAAYDKNANDVTANNLMVALIERGDYAEALKYADRISNQGIDPAIANNKAVLYGLTGEPMMARTLFGKAEGVPAAQYNKGVMQLQSHQYEQAAKTLAGYTTTDAVVSSIYAGKFEQAARQTHLAGSAPEMLYLRAVAYSAAGQHQLALKTLEAACAADGSLKHKAATQAEFIPLKEYPAFEAIIK